MCLSHTALVTASLLNKGQQTERDVYRKKTFSPDCCSPGRSTIFSFLWNSPSPKAFHTKGTLFWLGTSHTLCICAMAVNCIFLESNRQSKKLTASSVIFFFPVHWRMRKLGQTLGEKGWKSGWCQESIYGRKYYGRRSWEGKRWLSCWTGINSTTDCKSLSPFQLFPPFLGKQRDLGLFDRATASREWPRESRGLNVPSPQYLNTPSSPATPPMNFWTGSKFWEAFYKRWSHLSQ